ncbi:hypothetical protein ACJ6WE_18145 [Streptomyces sp. MMS24-I31]|uniref:hypothetical protein n=1 Tax=Streptomyces sp. MMS24-I31 TaxID=3351563 RepID=UPI003896CF90
MTRPPAARVLHAGVLGAAVLLATTACGSGGTDRAAGAPSAAAAASRPSAPGSASPVGALTTAQAQSALLTEADLGGPWAPTQGAATWRDGVLKARTDAPDCQRLLDALYADELLGVPTATQAVAGFDDADDAAQLHYQVLALRAADVDRTLAWLRTLPQKCARFTATTTRAGVQDVQVLDLALPEAGDARQGLRIAFFGASDEGGDDHPHPRRRRGPGRRRRDHPH